MRLVKVRKSKIMVLYLEKLKVKVNLRKEEWANMLGKLIRDAKEINQKDSSFLIL